MHIFKWRKPTCALKPVRRTLATSVTLTLTTAGFCAVPRVWGRPQVHQAGPEAAALS